jgi:hypothetical protein
LFKHGYLVVTHYPGVKSDGSGDATAGIQQAIVDGYKNGYAVYFPKGTYTVSDTLKCYEWQLWDLRRNKAKNPDSKAHVLIGSTNNDDRPTIRLSPKARGFGDPARPRPLIAYRTFVAESKGAPQREVEPSHPLATPKHFRDGSTTLFGAELRGINFNLSGHAGAIGVTFPAAQNSTIESVNVEATGAYAGFGGIPGRNAGAANIAVNGGRFGVIVGKQPGIVPGSSAGSIIVGARLTDQIESAIKQTDFAPLAVVGFHITGTSNRVMRVYHDNWSTSAGTLSMIDGNIEAPAGSTAIENTAGCSIHLRNVYVGGTNKLIAGKDTPVVTGSGSWSRIDEYAYNEQFGTDAKMLSYKSGDY